MALIVILLLFPPLLQAQEKTVVADNLSPVSGTESASLPLWEAGLFGMGATQPAYPGADERASFC